MSHTPPVLDRLWNEIPTGRPPLEDLLTAGRTRRRRRRTAAAVATAVVLVAGVGFATASGGSDGPGATDPAQPSDHQVADPSVPDGYRLVGIGRVAVDVGP